MISNYFSQVENGILTPSSIKINMNINNYPNEHPGTFLSLLVDLRVKSTSEKDITFEKLDNSFDESLGLSSDEKELRITAGDFSGFFSWVQYAEVDGKNEEVHINEYPYHSKTSDYSNGDTGYSYSSVTYHVLFSYPKGNYISHDPKIGIITIDNIDLYKIEIPEYKEQTQFNWDNMVFILTVISTIIFIILSNRLRRV
jgi:hypothetical protein